MILFVAKLIGWFDGETIYLDEHETTIIVQQMATQQTHSLSQPATVKNRLVEKGWLLAGTEAGKTRYTVKSPIPLEGARRQGLRISLGRLGVVGRSGPLLFRGPAGWGSSPSCTIDRQDNPTASGTSAP